MGELVLANNGAVFEESSNQKNFRLFWEQLGQPPLSGFRVSHDVKYNN